MRQMAELQAKMTELSGAKSPPPPSPPRAEVERDRQLQEQLQQLEARVASLKAKRKAKPPEEELKVGEVREEAPPQRPQQPPEAARPCRVRLGLRTALRLGPALGEGGVKHRRHLLLDDLHDARHVLDVGRVLLQHLLRAVERRRRRRVRGRQAPPPSQHFSFGRDLRLVGA